jgi:hypothetical protein
VSSDCSEDVRYGPEKVHQNAGDHQSRWQGPSVFQSHLDEPMVLVWLVLETSRTHLLAVVLCKSSDQAKVQTRAVQEGSKTCMCSNLIAQLSRKLLLLHRNCVTRIWPCQLFRELREDCCR